MKAIILILALSFLLLLTTTEQFTSGRKHCLDKDFTVDALLVEPSQHFDDVHTIYFSTSLQRQRIDVNIMEPEPLAFSLYLRYDHGKMYIYDKKKDKCLVHALHGRLEPFCLSRNANHTGTVIIGGSLKADVWKENREGFKVRLILSSYREIPINIFTKGGTQSGVVMQEWFNYKVGVESEKVFDIPSACKKSTPSRNLRMLHMFP